MAIEVSGLRKSYGELEAVRGGSFSVGRGAVVVQRGANGACKTILLTTHYLDEAQALSDRVAIVKDGLIVAEGPPSELSSRPRSYRVSYQQNGTRVEVETEDPTELLHRLTGEALARGERLEGLSVSRPTLEDVYLELTAEQEGEAPA